ncbi:MAG: phosphoribosyltransferase family protein [Spirochaetes bacterium]|nr:phosphoribosyltransferase family protein [Spirochaetota bacterium]
MRKEFLPYQVVRNNAIRLARRAWQEGFVPDVIYVSLRGGAYMGNVISEFFKLVRRGDRPSYYAAVVARSYCDVGEQDRVKVDGWTYDPVYLRTGDKVMLVDDIFDSGRTINHLVEIIMDKGIPRGDVRVAVHDYKVRRYLDRQLPVQPDLWCRRHDLAGPEDDFWIHYLSHELVGLTDEEKREHYFRDDPELADALP